MVPDYEMAALLNLKLYDEYIWAIYYIKALLTPYIALFAIL